MNDFFNRVFKRIKTKDQVAVVLGSMVLIGLLLLLSVKSCYAGTPHIVFTLGGGYELGDQVTFSADKSNHLFVQIELEVEFWHCSYVGYLHHSSPGHDANVVDAVTVSARMDFGGRGFRCGP